MGILEYMLITEDSASALMSSVNEQIQKGPGLWEPFGPPVITRYQWNDQNGEPEAAWQYAQAMVKRSEIIGRR